MNVQRLGFFLLIMSFCVSCSDECILEQTMPIVDDFSNISDPRDRWEAYDLDNYVIEQYYFEISLNPEYTYNVIVKNGEISEVVKTEGCKSRSGGYFQTVEELFATIEAVNPDSVAEFSVQYDPVYGYPTYIFIDYVAMLADEEYVYFSSNLEKLD